MYRYIDKKAPDFENTIEQLMGTCVHKAIELAYGSESTTADQILCSYDEAWSAGNPHEAHIVRSGVTADDYYTSGRDMVEHFHDAVYGQRDGETLALEKKFSITLTDGSKYRGVIDRIARMSAGVVQLIDFKTGKTVPNPKKDLQLRSYALYGLEAYHEDNIEICYMDLRGHEEPAAAIGKSARAGIEGILIDQIREVSQATSFHPNVSGLCGWCSYKYQCPHFDS
jgi:putative RecB family exonuclease